MDADSAIQGPYKTPGLQADFDLIMDTMSGGDNGSFVGYLMLTREMDTRAAAGDAAAAELLKVITRFARYIRAARGK